MGIPWSAPGRMELSYQVAGLTHRARYPCRYLLVAGVPLVWAQSGGAYTVAPATLATKIWTVMRALFAPAVLDPTWVFSQFTLGAFVPLISGATSVGPGTSVGVTSQAFQYAGVFRDSLNHRFNSYLFEIAGIGLSNKATVGANAPIDTYNANVTGTGDATKFGDNIVSRGNNLITRFINWSTDTNERIERARHL